MEWEEAAQTPKGIDAYNLVRGKHELWVNIEIQEKTVSIRYLKSKNLDEKPCYTWSEIRTHCKVSGQSDGMCADSSLIPTCIHPSYELWISDLFNEINFALRKLKIIQAIEHNRPKAPIGG